MSQAPADLGAATTQFPVPSGALLLLSTLHFIEAEALQQRKPLVTRLTKIDLLVIEDFGVKRLGPDAAEDLLEVFVRRHERASTVVTTNRPIQGWGGFFGDIPAATAILDRFLSHAEVVQTQGKSYRMHLRSLRSSAQADVQS
jgi:DNA replication protein DnaC